MHRTLVSEMDVPRTVREAMTHAVKTAPPDRSKIVVDWRMVAPADGSLAAEETLPRYQMTGARYELPLDEPIIVPKAAKLGRSIHVHVLNGGSQAEARLIFNQEINVTRLTGPEALWMLDDCRRQFGALCPDPEAPVPAGRYDYRYWTSGGSPIPLVDVRHPDFGHILLAIRASA